MWNFALYGFTTFYAKQDIIQTYVSSFSMKPLSSQSRTNHYSLNRSHKQSVTTNAAKIHIYETVIRID